MKVSIQTLGSLGDVMPYITTAKRLKSLGAEVSILAPRDYTDIILANGIDAATPPDFSLRDWDKEAEERGTLAGPLSLLRDWSQMVTPYVSDIMVHCLEAAEGADVILANSVCAPARLAAEANRIPFILHALQPVISPTGEAPCAMVWRPWHGRALNRSGYVTIWAALQLMEQAVKDQRRQLGLRDMPGLSHTRTHLGQPLPRVTSVSPALMDHRPADWRENDHLLSYPSLDRASPSDLPAAVRDFADAGDRPVYVGLGSLEAETHVQTLTTMFTVLKQMNIRAFLSAGLRDKLPPELASGHHVVGNIPHAALFQICSGVIHHGGAGTVDTGLRAGCPQVIVPDILDQYWHAKRLNALGVAPKTLGQKSIDAETFRQALDFIRKPETIARARALSERLCEQDGAQELAAFTISQTERFQRCATQAR
ncbi:MAG: hypothetical protein VR75_00530 [Hyphomonadaceae bacterium BRH_c29]|nr:MAG: hypothetical protein VR75_00530 [Hyphomonadaceae bacterium BRH_c29]